MSYIVGISDNITNYASTAALSAVDVTAASNGKIVTDGQLAAVTGGRMYIYVKNSSAAVSSTILAATGGGRWYEYFAYTGQTYLLVNDSNNTLTLTDGSVVLADLASGIAPAYITVAAGTKSYAGGATTTTQTVSNALAGDLVFANVITATNACTMRPSLSGTTITFTFTADPGAATTINYQLLRAAS